MDDRYSRDIPPGREYGRGYGDYDGPRDYASGRDYTYSSARDYAASGEDFERRPRGGYGRGDYGGRSYGSGYGGYGYGAYDRGYEDRGWARDADRDRNRAWNRDRGERDFGRDAPRDYRDRGFLDRAGDEVRAWFGDEEAERRRELDQRYDERRAGTGRFTGRAEDDHYHNWRRSRIAELDRDYDEYRNENAQRFENEFSSWRTERQGQRQGLSRVAEHMEVIGSDGQHVGTVDKVRGDRILLTKGDKDAGGHHHSIPSRWIQSVDDKVTIRKTAEEAKAHWRDEERSNALFGNEDDRDDQSWKSDHNLNRSFSGTY